MLRPWKLIERDQDVVEDSSEVRYEPFPSDLSRRCAVGEDAIVALLDRIRRTDGREAPRLPGTIRPVPEAAAIGPPRSPLPPKRGGPACGAPP